MNLFQQVLVAVGDANRDAELLRYARTVRDLSPPAEFHFVHVLGWSGNSRNEPVTHEKSLRELEHAVGRHFGEDGSPACQVIHGNVIDRLLEIAAESSSDLILVGHAAEHSGRRSTARRLAMKAPCSVWMRPHGSAMEIHRILAAVDFSEPSAYALSLASRIANRAGSAECLALHVGVEDRSAAPLDTEGVPLLFEDAPSVTHAVERVAETSGVDLVVMGSRGQSRSVNILLGSESDHMLMESRIPVLIAKRRGERIGLLEALLFDREFQVHGPLRP